MDGALALKRDRADPQNRDRDASTAGLIASMLADHKRASRMRR